MLASRCIASLTLAVGLNAQAQAPSAAGTIYKQAGPAVVLIVAYNDKGEPGWTGTGFIVAADGKILTNYHVIRNSKQATVLLPNKDAYDNVEVMDVDERKDIALMKIKAVDLPYVRIGNSNGVQIGDPVYSLSNPVGLDGTPLDNTLSEGIISGVRQMLGYRLFQITAPISHGSSGGPLFNAKAEVIGITSGSYGGQALNLAIPIDYARGMLASPSQPKPLASVYNPEKPAEPPPNPNPAPTPPPTPAPGPASEPTKTAAKATLPLPDEMRQNIGIYLEKKLRIWTQDDVSQYLGQPLAHRPGYDNAHNIISDIYNYPDPTALYQHIELNFDAKTNQMVGIFMYPARMTWDDCKRVWGDDVNVMRNPDGSQFRAYKNRHLNVLIDRRSNVVSIGVY